MTPLTTNLQRDQYGGRGRPKHHVSRDQLQAGNVDAGLVEAKLLELWEFRKGHYVEGAMNLVCL